MHHNCSISFRLFSNFWLLNRCQAWIWSETLEGSVFLYLKSRRVRLRVSPAAEIICK